MGSRLVEVRSIARMAFQRTFAAYDASRGRHSFPAADTAKVRGPLRDSRLQWPLSLSMNCALRAGIGDTTVYAAASCDAEEMKVPLLDA